MTSDRDPAVANADIPSSARVVVIGGGVVGCSVAYHLARCGWSDVVLLERHKLNVMLESSGRASDVSRQTNLEIRLLEDKASGLEDSVIEQLRLKNESNAEKQVAADG